MFTSRLYPLPEQAEVAVTESEGSSTGKVTGVLLITASLLIGFLLFANFPMPQRYTVTTDEGTQVFTTECTIAGDVLWTPSPSSVPDQVQEAEDYCGRWSGTVVALSLVIPLIGVVAGSLLMARRHDDTPTDDPDGSDGSDEHEPAPVAQDA